MCRLISVQSIFVPKERLLQICWALGNSRIKVMRNKASQQSRKKETEMDKDKGVSEKKSKSRKNV